MPRDVSLSDSKCWNGGKKWVNIIYIILSLIRFVKFAEHQNKICDVGPSPPPPLMSLSPIWTHILDIECTEKRVGIEGPPEPPPPLLSFSAITAILQQIFPHIVSPPPLSYCNE